MSSLTLPNWPTTRALIDEGSFRSWLRQVASPNGPNSNGPGKRLPRVLAPIAVQTELGRGANEMLAEALSAGPDHLPERMAVVSERISECMELSAMAGNMLLHDLKHRIFTPIHVEDLFQLSRLLVCGTGRLGAIASTISAMRMADSALHPVHLSVERTFGIINGVLGQLDNRDRTHLAILQLAEQRDTARQFCRDYFFKRASSQHEPSQLFATAAARKSYGNLVAYLGTVEATLYRTALKNG